MEWNEFIEKLTNSKNEFDEIVLSIDPQDDPSQIPRIIKATVLLIDKIIDSGQLNNIIMFPERNYSPLIYTLIKLIQNITQGKIAKDYDLSKFVKGQKLKYKRSVMEFVGVEQINESQHLIVNFSDLLYHLPIELAPYLQQTDAKTLSSYNNFTKYFKISQVKQANDIISVLRNYRTHMDKSLVYVSTLSSTKEKLSHWMLNNYAPSEIFLIGQVKWDGTIQNIVKGKLSGTPSMLLAKDLDSVYEAIKKNVPIQSVIIDVNSEKAIENQVDVINELMNLDIPITFLVDPVSSYNLDFLESRSFTTWRWDKEYLTPSLYSNSIESIGKKYNNFANQSIRYKPIQNDYFSPLFYKLRSAKSEISLDFEVLVDVFSNLMAILLRMIRSMTPINIDDKLKWSTRLSESSELLNRYQDYISPDAYQNFSDVITELGKIISLNQLFPKIEKVEQEIITNNYSIVNLIVEDRSNVDFVKTYWENRKISNQSQATINVYSVRDYLDSKHDKEQDLKCRLTIVSGWFSENISKKIIYSLLDVNYLFILYGCEQRWTKIHTAKWARKRDKADNNKLSNTTFQFKRPRQLADSSHYNIPDVDDSLSLDNDLQEIEFIMTENRFRKYQVTQEQAGIRQIVSALPVIFAGGYLSFLRESRKVITVTGIIINNDSDHEMKTASDLRVGDFIVLRETDRDIIKDIADVILKKQKKEKLRDLATRWRLALEKDQKFHSFDNLYNRLINAGCIRNRATIHAWVFDENRISPQELDDIKLIAEVTFDKELSENAETVFQAARHVTSAHIEAGRYLSGQLIKKIASSLHDIKDIDLNTINKPLDFHLEGIGPVKVLKITDIWKMRDVDALSTNRLLEE